MVSSTQTNALERVDRIVLVADVVESVRLMDDDEDEFVRRLVSLMDVVGREVMPRFQGRLVKSTGDGFIAEFQDARSAVMAGFDIVRHTAEANETVEPGARLHLRVGIEKAAVYVADCDLLGRGVNRASRLASLASPSEIVVSAPVRAQLTASLDAEVEDLGHCFLKHIKGPVHAFVVRPVGSHPVLEPRVEEADLFPLVAVVPLSTREDEGTPDLFGEVVAEELIRALSHATDLHVVSRLTTTVFRDRRMSAHSIGRKLDANYVISGRCRQSGRTVTVDLELFETATGSVLSTEQFHARGEGLSGRRRDLVGSMVEWVTRTILAQELKRVRSRAIPTLESSSLLIAAVGLMHRLSHSDFEEAEKLLHALVERAPREAIPLAWLAKWHVLRVQQGWSEDPSEDSALALQCTRRALNTDPECPLALAIDGFVQTNLLKRMDAGLDRYERALESNPSEPLAWLLKGTLHAFKGEGGEAIRCTQRALKLSPLDPHRFFYDSLSATAYLSARQYERALHAATRSFRANRTHTSTLRAMAVAQWQLGLRNEARSTCAALLTLDPGFTVSGWCERSPSYDFPIGREWAAIFRDMGIPD
ncbi:adenylate/guanylate cyclase domain-containing protein [Prosthecomicrobium sp. N25]|uniref:adenylate/guanylate cyclase domain-containing protein n=1 Tax=Prosthecomicrobium sp. N25 TaxID=3129254 RepID=UPI003078A3A1